MNNDTTLATAVLGGGCFWCLEAVYQRLDGVSKVESGYAGGHQSNPTYAQVCAKQTGHAEVVRITFDPGVISFAKLLEMFWKVHDPTTPNRQGNDVGPQYRSIILYVDEQQKQQAEDAIAAAKDQFKAPIVTELKMLDEFWVAETEHHDYYNRNKLAPYCLFNIRPKLAKIKP